MGTHVSPHLFEGEHLVRTVEKDGEVWFVGGDACRILELKNPRSSLALLDEDEKGVHSMDTLGGNQEVTIVSEPGIYRLIFASRKPIAERFKRWLAHDVIPAIRKTGSYSQERAAGEKVDPAPDEPIAVRKGLVTEARHTFSVQAARELWFKLGLTTTPSMSEEPRQGVLFYTAVPQAPARAQPEASADDEEAA